MTKYQLRGQHHQEEEEEKRVCLTCRWSTAGPSSKGCLYTLSIPSHTHTHPTCLVCVFTHTIYHSRTVWVRFSHDCITLIFKLDKHRTETGQSHSLIFILAKTELETSAFWMRCVYTCVCFRPGYLTQSYTVDEMTQVLAIHRLCAWEKVGKGTNASAPIRSEMCVCASGGDHAHVSLAFFSFFQSSPLLDDDGKGRRRNKREKQPPPPLPPPPDTQVCARLAVAIRARRVVRSFFFFYPTTKAILWERKKKRERKWFERRGRRLV